MRIGVFGDSYASKADKHHIWCGLLEEYGHKVSVLGAPGSSIEYSAMMVDSAAALYDFVIWCLTVPGRFSFRALDTNEYVHSTSDIEYVEDKFKSRSAVAKQLQVCKDYQHLIQNTDTESFVGQCIAEAMLRKHKNLMIIPCFYLPLASEFYLYKVSEKELDLQPGSIDTRHGHLFEKNHRILAALVNNNLNPGIFQTDINNFHYDFQPH